MAAPLYYVQELVAGLIIFSALFASLIGTGLILVVLSSACQVSFAWGAKLVQAPWRAQQPLLLYGYGSGRTENRCARAIDCTVRARADVKQACGWKQRPQ